MISHRSIGDLEIKFLNAVFIFSYKLIEAKILVNWVYEISVNGGLNVCSLKILLGYNWQIWEKSWYIFDDWIIINLIE